ncbi:MAG: CDP-alcohol phosphatidyltransferase family protein [Bacteroidaceae bacterium]|nr:CDP-alcohol phosphatidyltransferase family protein [Bacteroidaceae bacterium]
MKRQIPNLITLCNLLCGGAAVMFAFNGYYTTTLFLVCLGALFDFFDGFTARLLGVSSPIGKELDSLADDITFGLAPAAICCSLLADTPQAAQSDWGSLLFPYLGLIIAAASAYRLAKFNLDERQTMGFIGLPTPANALFWTALAVGAGDWLTEQSYAVWLLLGGIVLSAYLLVSEIPMFALKFKTFGVRGNELRYGFLAVAAVLIVWQGLTGLALVVPLYIAMSVIAALATKQDKPHSAL